MCIRDRGVFGWLVRMFRVQETQNTNALAERVGIMQEQLGAEECDCGRYDERMH